MTLLVRWRSAKAIVSTTKNIFEKRNGFISDQGVDVMIAIFCDFRAIFGEKNWRFSQKPMLRSKFCIIYLCFETKTPIFSLNFSAKIFKKSQHRSQIFFFEIFRRPFRSSRTFSRIFLGQVFEWEEGLILCFQNLLRPHRDAVLFCKRGQGRLAGRHARNK
jgi:hypothetical protein